MANAKQPVAEPPTFELWLEFELYPNDYDPTDDVANVQVTLLDGRRYAMNVWTFGFMRRAPYYSSLNEEWTGTPAEYVLPPDLLVERLDRPTMERVVTELLATGQIRDEWLCPPETGEKP